MLGWRLYADSVESDPFYGDFKVKSVWRLSGVLCRNHQINRLSPYKLLDDRGPMARVKHSDATLLNCFCFDQVSKFVSRFLVSSTWKSIIAHIQAYSFELKYLVSLTQPMNILLFKLFF